MKLPDLVRKNNTATIIYNMMPVSHNGLKERINVSRDAIARAIKLLKSIKLIYITGYESSKNTLYAKYDKGNKPDLLRPTPRELENARTQRWREKNKEMELAAQLRYRERNREKLTEKQKEYYKINRVTILQIARMKPLKLKPFIATQWRVAPPWLESRASN
jgi:hypothetical protein